MKKFLFLIASILSLQLALPAYAQFAKPDDAVVYRQAAFQILRAHFGNIGAVVTGKVPYDKAAVLKDANVVAFVAHLPWAAFAVEGGKKNEAKPAVWSKSAEFKTCAKNLEDGSATLQSAAEKGDLAQIKTAFGAVAQNVKKCHEQFKED